jgi:type VI secretion system protein ImpE
VTTQASTAEMHLKLGELGLALDALQAAVRANPSDAKLRIFLFQLLCVLGDWKRATLQLKVSAELDPDALSMAQTYREAIICEVYREKVFAGEKAPLIFGEPPQWIAYLIEALGCQARAQFEEAARLRELAFDQAEASAGTQDGTTFDWVADADMRLGPVLEAVINGKYYWLPFSAIQRLEMDPPSVLRDVVWAACTITLRNDGEFVALIPTRYAGTTQGSDAEKLSRLTSWSEDSSGAYCGLGQRLLTTDQGEVSLLELKSLEFAPATQTGV